MVEDRLDTEMSRESDEEKRRGIPEYMWNQVVLGDAFELVKEIPDGSIDLILADPIYWNYVHYLWSAEEAIRLLRPGGSLILQAGNLHRHIAESTMDQAGDDLQICPTINEIMTGGSQQLFPCKAVVKDKPYIWRMKRGGKSKGWMPTLIRGLGKDKKHHEWGDTPAVFKMAIERLTDPGDVILDPFTGKGTVPVVCVEYGRNFVAFEIDEISHAIAVSILANTQTPLLVPERSDQIELGWEVT